MTLRVYKNEYSESANVLTISGTEAELEKVQNTVLAIREKGLITDPRFEALRAASRELYDLIYKGAK